MLSSRQRSSKECSTGEAGGRGVEAVPKLQQFAAGFLKINWKIDTLVARSPHIEHVPFILPVPGPVVVVVIAVAAAAAAPDPPRPTLLDFIASFFSPS